MADNTAEGSQKSRLANLEGGQHELDVFDQGLPWSLAQANDQAGERAQPDTSVRVSGPPPDPPLPPGLQSCLMLYILFTASC